MSNAAQEAKRPMMGYSGNLTIRPGDLIAELFENRDAVEEKAPAAKRRGS